MRKRSVVLLVIGGLVLIVIIASIASAVGQRPNQKLSAASSAAARAASLAAALRSAERACADRPPASRDVYVRIVRPGHAPQVRRLSGRWRWDHATRRCLTAVRFMTATAPRAAGHCTQVGYVTGNPGYNARRRPAPPLPHVAAQAGPACATAVPAAPSSTATPSSPAPATTPPAQSTPPAQTAPPTTAAPTTAPPPAPTTQAGCHPLSNEGTCYEPGEYCREDDHGVTGVAGDGQTIICEDNDGWRWEPA